MGVIWRLKAFAQLKAHRKFVECIMWVKRVSLLGFQIENFPLRTSFPRIFQAPLFTSNYQCQKGFSSHPGEVSREDSSWMYLTLIWLMKKCGKIATEKEAPVGKALGNRYPRGTFELKELCHTQLSFEIQLKLFSSLLNLPASSREPKESVSWVRCFGNMENFHLGRSEGDSYGTRYVLQLWQKHMYNMENLDMDNLELKKCKWRQWNQLKLI